jgi:GntR family transcriptional regulator
MVAEVLDRGSDTALWRQVAGVLKQAISTGEFPSGERLPSEAELTTRFGISRVTLRQALRALADRGLIRSVAGKGWFVGLEPDSLTNRPLYEPPGVLQSFSEMARSRGLFPDSVLLHCAVRPATWDESAELAVAPGAPLLSLRRLRRMDGLPMAIDHSLIPAVYLPDVDPDEFVTGSLHEGLRRRGYSPARAQYEVQAINADSEQARLLDVEPGTALLSATELLDDSHGRRIEKGHIIYPGDRYRFRAELLP